MIARVSITVAALAALLLTCGSAMAGGMPSDEGPEVVLGEPQLEALFTPTITTIIEHELPQYIEISDIKVEAIEPEAIEITEAIEIEVLAGGEVIDTATAFFKLPPAFMRCPQYGCGHDL